MNNIIKKIKEDNYIFYKIILFLLSITIISIFFILKETELFHYCIAGKEWLLNGKITKDPWYIKDGYATYIQQWLYCIFVYVIFSKFSYTGIACIVLITAILFIFVYNKTLSLIINKKVSFVIGLFAYAIIFYPNIRNEVLTLILLLIQIYCIEKYKKNINDNRKWLYILPILTLLEINLHGLEYYFHFIFLLPYLVPVFKNKIIKNDNLPIKDFILPIILMIGSLFINPYGYQMPILITKCLDVRYFVISEFQHIEFGSLPFYLIIFLVIFLILMIIEGTKNNQLTSTSFWFMLGCTFLGITAYRNVKFFIFTILFASQFFDKNKLIIFHKNKKNMVGFFLIYSMYIILMFNFVCACIKTNTENKSIPVVPKDIIDYIYENEKNPKNLNIFTDEGNGAYFAYYCNCKIMYQARTEMYYKSVNGKEDLAKLFYDIKNNLTEDLLNKLQNEYKYDYVYSGKNSELYKVCKQSKNYKEVVENEHYSFWMYIDSEK